ncbi:MAG: LysR family transcriptional regulator, partial [Alphaproteobacteria bacterium]|nr:LysR family transcriptional regulator [Alphaproteobacteria bacterium]
MNIEHLRTFLDVAQTGSFHRSARRLNVSQSTVSARIKALEDSLDRVLFNRTKTGAT